MKWLSRSMWCMFTGSLLRIGVGVLGNEDAELVTGVELVGDMLEFVGKFDDADREALSLQPKFTGGSVSTVPSMFPRGRLGLGLLARVEAPRGTAP